MTTVYRTAALLVLAATAAGAQTTQGRKSDSWSTRERLASGDRLRISSPNGAITITEGSGSEVEVTAEKRPGRDGSVEDIAFVVRRTSAGMIVCAVYEDEDECDMERGYRQRSRRSGWGNKASANFTVRIPAGILVRAETGNGAVSINGAGSEVIVTTGNGRVLVTETTGRVKATTGNGKITVDGASGPVEATTGNGDVRVVTSSGPVNASSGNGDIEISMDRLSRASEMRFATGSGNITLAVPDDFGAEMNATTGNGRVSTDLPVRLAGRITPNRLNGTLGDGGERLTLSTGNGDIQIRKSSH